MPEKLRFTLRTIMPSVSPCHVMYRRLDHRNIQHAASTERPAASAGPATTGSAARNPFSGQSQASQPVLAAVAEGGSGSDASPTDSPAGRAGNVSAPEALPAIAAEERLVGGALIQSLETLQRLCQSPEGQRLAHARVGQLGRHQVCATFQRGCWIACTAKSI